MSECTPESLSICLYALFELTSPERFLQKWLTPLEKFKSSKVTFRHVVNHFPTLDERSLSDVYYVRGLPWQIEVEPFRLCGKKELSLSLYCADAEGWEMHTLSCDVRAVLRIVSQKQGVPDMNYEIEDRFGSSDSSGAYPMMLWKDVCDADKGYIKDDVVIFEAEVISVVPDVSEAKHGRYLEMVNQVKYVAKDDRPEYLYRRDHLFPFVLDPAGSKALADVTLVCQDKTFYCSRAMLTTRSTTFRRMFLGDFPEAYQKPISLDDDNISGNTMLEILRFIYCKYTATDLSQASLELQYEFLYAAEKYDLKQLVDLVAFALEEGLQPSNACPCLLIADRFRLVSLKILCFAIMENPDNERAICSSPEFEELERNKELVKEFLYFV